MRFKAYLFDVQGTLMDFFGPVSAAVGRYLDGIGADRVDAAEFTRGWRRNYFHRIADNPPQHGNWRRVQEHYEAGFVATCAQHGLPEPDRAVAEAVASSWQRLQPWPDVRAGIARLRERAVVAALSNTDMSTAISLFKGHAIDMDAIFTAEIFEAFKPDPTVYRRALRYLGVQPHEAAMVASHPYDLESAGAVGMGTVFVRRPLEYGDPVLAHEMPGDSVGQRVRSIGEIA